MSITNYKFRITNLKSAFRFFVILFVLFVFPGKSFAQKEDVFADWTARSSFLSQQISGGTTEQKRGALLEIRNLETADASRIAVSALRDASEIVRATAAASVVFLPTDEAARNLLPILRDKKPLVRREAAYALGQVRNPGAISSLLQVAQKDKVLEVRNAAVIALGEIGDVSAVNELVKFLQRKPQTKEEFLRRSAARSIGQIAQIVQTGRLEAVTPENFLPEPYKPLSRSNYPKLIESFPPFRFAIALLIQILQNPKEFQDVKREAAFALGAIGDESAVPILQNNLGSEDYYLAEICRESLKKIALAGALKPSAEN
jgi:HEAT repeat protein